MRGGPLSSLVADEYKLLLEEFRLLRRYKKEGTGYAVAT